VACRPRVSQASHWPAVEVGEMSEEWTRQGCHWSCVVEEPLLAVEVAGACH
jgi:hypothetical protein